MRLKALEIHGFKTFTEPLTLTFPGSLTGVVGPNGSGKSNIVDAVRWVLGENNPRRLRATSPADLIFHGSAACKAMGMAEVSITLENLTGRLTGAYAGLEEVTVTRRLHQDGQSENFINRAACRLKDIRELFLDTGLGTQAYSIIQQGQIAFLLEAATPQDRRILIEEAAGILKYRERKIEALRKLDQAQTNLARVEDLIGELERQTKTLKRQAKRAEGYKGLVDRWRTVDLLYRSLRLARLLAERDGVRRDLEGRTDERNILQARLAGIEGELSACRLRLAEWERSLAGLREELTGARTQVEKVEAERGHLLERGKEGARRLEFLTMEARAAAERMASVTSRREEAVGQVAALAAREEEVAHACSELKWSIGDAERREVEAEEDARSKERAIFDLQNRITEAKNQQSLLELHRKQTSQRASEVAAERSTVGQRLAEAKGSLDRNEDGRRALATEIGAAAAALADASRVLKQREEERDGLEETIRDLETRWTRLLSRREVLVESLERDKDPGEAARSLMKDPEIPVKGQVLDLVDVEPGYETAIGVALGETVRGLAVEDFDRCLALLGRRVDGNSGRVILCPIDSWPIAGADDAGDPPQGSVGWAGAFIRPGPFQALFRRLLSGTAVASSLEGAVRRFQQSPSLHRIVTPEGAMVHRSGLLEGGTVTGAAVAVRLQVDLKGIQAEAAAIESQISAARERRESVRIALEAARETLALAGGQKEALERELLRLTEEERHCRSEVSRLEETHRDLDAEFAVTEEESRRIDTAQRESGSALAMLEAGQEELERARSSSSAGLDEARRRRQDLALEHSRKEAEVRAAAQQRETALLRVEELAHTLDELAKGGAALAREEEETRGGIAEARARAEGLVQAIVDAQERVRALTEALAEREGTRDLPSPAPLEAEIKDLKAQIASREEGIQSCRIAIAEREKEAELLHEALYTDHAITVEELPAPEGDEDALHAELVDLTRKKDQYGPVNQEALAEFREVEGRYTFLSSQRNDLVQSIDSLKQAIAHINQVSRERFMTTFQQVREKFADLIPVLFKGGKGDMVLTPEEDVLEAGVEFLVAPPGKRVRHLGQLSGGEKALVALAYLLAIYLIQPTPFCLLDEVDAPLDDPNILHFLNLINTLKTGSQFILVTHNKLTMEAADLLYGVAMDRPGVSRVMAVRLEEAVESGKAVAAP